MIGALILLGFLGTMVYFSNKQERLNRAMDANADSRREAGYVGPHVSGPY